VDQGAPSQPLTGTARGAPQRASQGRAALNGLAPHVAAVEAARERLGEDLDQLTYEVRAQVDQTMQKTLWKALATGAAIVAGIAIRKLLEAGWQKARHTDPPANPAAPGTTWGEALGWTVASGIGVGLARLIAQRGAAAGWRKATGALPPGLEDVVP
jgi:hypothetical protein